MNSSNSPLVSIVTPSYNQDEFIEDNLNSVSGQDYDNIEHIVIDGGSDDDSLNILEQYEEQYNLKWTSEPDEGQSHAINKGFDRASGDYIGWLNSDDVYFDKKVISRVVEHFQSKDPDILFGDIALIDKNATIFSVRARPNYVSPFIPYTNPIMQPAAFFKQNVITNHRIDNSLEFSLDYEFWIQLVQTGFEFQHRPDILAGFRKHSEQKTSDVTNRIRKEKTEILKQKFSMPFHVHLMSTVMIESAYDILSLKRAYELNQDQELAFDGGLDSSYKISENILSNLMNRITIKKVKENIACLGTSRP